MTLRTAAIVFAGVTIIHLIVQFVVWSISSGNAVPAESPTWLAMYGWRVFSFPVFSILPSSLSNNYFWMSLIVNSAIWGGLVSVGLFFVTRDSTQSTNA